MKSINSKKYRWYIFAILSLSYLIVNLHRLSVGSVAQELTTEFKLTSFTLANLGSTYFYAYMLMQIPTGILADTLGPRITVSIGSGIAAIGSILPVSFLFRIF